MHTVIASFSFTLRIIIRGIINAEHGCSPESACMLFWGFLIQDIVMYCRLNGKKTVIPT